MLARRFKRVPRVVRFVHEDLGLSWSVSADSGGELCSLAVRRDGRFIELLHRANEFGSPGAAWRGRAPWLFPAVGRSRLPGRRDAYALNGKVYSMPIHGLVMNKPWKMLAAGPQGVVCRTFSDRRTLSRYPFDFELTVSYRPMPDGLLASAEVAAAPGNKSPMPFCIGNHITLALPLAGGVDAGACIVKTPAAQILELSPDGFLTGHSRPAPYSLGVALRDDAQLADCVLGGFPEGQAWVELRDPSGASVRVSQRADAPSDRLRFVLYSDAGRAFLCPEPWIGEPDSLNTERGLMCLDPGERFNFEMRLTLA